MPGESQRTDKNVHFLMRWTYVIVCVAGPLSIVVIGRRTLTRKLLYS